VSRVPEYLRPWVQTTHLLLWVILLLTGCHESTRLAALPPGSTVLAFGNSITFGSGANPGEDYPARLAAISGWQVHNAGIPGDTAETARSRVGEAIAGTRPALVIVEIGGNDFLRRRAETAVKDDLRAIVAAIRQSGAQVVLVAVPRLSLIGAASGRIPDSTIYAELAREEKLPIVEGVLAAILSDPAMKADLIHPNAQGYTKLAEGLGEQLTRIGLLRKP
jgi:acyl-CoA thioesterase-1